MQRRLPDDFLPMQHQQRQVPLEIRVPAPFLENLAVKNRPLDEQTLLLRHSEEKFVQAGFIPFAQGTYISPRKPPLTPYLRSASIPAWRDPSP